MNTVIEQEVRIEAPIEQVVTDSPYVAKWLGDTPVRLVESGFADGIHYKENTEGWTAELMTLASTL